MVCTSPSPPPPSPPPSPPPPPPVWTYPTRADGALAFGDPHLILAHGARADFRGRHGGIFNFLSDQNLSVNVLISNSSFYLRGPMTNGARVLVHGTAIAEVYIVGRTSSGRYFYVTHSPVLTASCTSRGASAPLSTIQPFHRGSCDDLRVSTTSSQMTLASPAWRITSKRLPTTDYFSGLRHRFDVSIEPLQPEDKRATMPHGLMGQAWDGDGLAIDGQMDSYPTVQGAEFTTYAQLEGAIEGAVSDYEVSGPHEVGFKYSRFGTVGAKARNASSMVRSCIASVWEQRPGSTDIRTAIRRVACRSAQRRTDCTDTPRALVGLQPRVAADCAAGLPTTAEFLGSTLHLNRTVQSLCTDMSMDKFLSVLAPLGVPYIVPSGFTSSSTWAEICPETCRTHGVRHTCLDA